MFIRKQRKGTRPNLVVHYMYSVHNYIYAILLFGVVLIRLIVRFDDDMVARFTDEDDFIIEIEFDNQKGHFDLYVLY